MRARARSRGALPCARRVTRAGLALLLPPRQGRELAAVFGDLDENRLAAVENGHAAVGIQCGLALDDERAQHPALAVELEIAFDVDQALVGEVAVQGEVAVHVEEALAAGAVVGELASGV